MKGRALILIFLFLVLLSSVSAESGTFVHVGSTSRDENRTNNEGSPTDDVYIRVPNPVTLNKINNIQVVVTEAWSGSTDDSNWAEVHYTLSGDTIGTGYFGYNKNAAGQPVVIAFFDGGLDLSSHGSTVIGISIVVDSGSHGVNFHDGSNIHGGNGGADMAYVAKNTLGSQSACPVGINSVDVFYDQTFTYNYSSSQGYYKFDMGRSAGMTSTLNITNGGDLDVSESTQQSGDYYEVSADVDNNTWVLTNTNVFGDVETDTIYFTLVPGDTYGVINFNQSHYTDPEDIQVEWEIEDYDGDSYNYEIQVITSASGVPSQDSWPADGSWNTSTYVSTASGAAVFDFYSDNYDLPIWVQAELWAQDKSSGTWTKLDSTPIGVYHEVTPEAGKVWTNKESYNVTEIVIIYTDTAEGGYLWVDKRNDPLSDSYTIYSGLSHIKFALQTSHVGTWDVYLYEDSIMTNSTVFTVLADNDTAYFSWWGDVQKGEAAYYDYVATSSNSVISVYDGIGEKQYSFNATPGYNEGQISTMPGAAGNWTGSLYDGGVYYNSSLEVYASESWIRFEDDVYYMGDTILIEYFIVDPDYNIYLRDGLCPIGGRTTIVKWTPGSFHTGQRGTLEFTLSNDNEFGLQVKTNFESGLYLPGIWRVEAAGMTETTGWGSVDDTTHVHGTAKESTGDPADTSNEMISIFFSPEGAFMLFTVCLTMMGLVAVKHPAGGGAGAVVGVGFGVYFNALPVWMLMVMVIALVVMAGVSIASHFGGK